MGYSKLQTATTITNSKAQTATTITNSKAQTATTITNNKPDVTIRDNEKRTRVLTDAAISGTEMRLRKKLRRF
jgi:hypothetical protein